MNSVLIQIMNWMPALLKGAGITLELTVTSMLAGLAIGVVMALGKISKNPILRMPATGYVFFFRGTPLLLQLFFIYFSLPMIIPAFNIKSQMTAAFIAFSLNIGAYLAENIRAAIQSIDKGQMEAARSLGLTPGQAMRLVVIPQTYRRLIPPICNEFVMTLKDTSLVAIIALNDLTFTAKNIASNRASTIVFIPTFIIYMILSGVFMTIFNRVEKKYSVYE